LFARFGCVPAVSLQAGLVDWTVDPGQSYLSRAIANQPLSVEGQSSGSVFLRK
jgi:hypothetical protein